MKIFKRSAPEINTPVEHDSGVIEQLQPNDLLAHVALSSSLDQESSLEAAVEIARTHAESYYAGFREVVATLSDVSLDLELARTDSIRQHRMYTDGSDRVTRDRVSQSSSSYLKLAELSSWITAAKMVERGESILPYSEESMIQRADYLDQHTDEEVALLYRVREIADTVTPLYVQVETSLAEGTDTLVEHIAQDGVDQFLYWLRSADGDNAALLGMIAQEVHGNNGDSRIAAAIYEATTEVSPQILERFAEMLIQDDGELNGVVEYFDFARKVLLSRKPQEDVDTKSLVITSYENWPKDVVDQFNEFRKRYKTSLASSLAPFAVF